MAVRAAAAEAGSLVAEAYKVRVAAGKRESLAFDERRRGGELFLWCAAARVEDDVVGVGDGDERNCEEQQTQRGEGGRHFCAPAGVAKLELLDARCTGSRGGLSNSSSCSRARAGSS